MIAFDQTSTQERSFQRLYGLNAFAFPGSGPRSSTVVGSPLVIAYIRASYRLVGRYPSVDDFGNIVVDIAAIGVRPVVEFDHLLAFFLGMGFHRSQRGRHDLDSGRAHQIES